MDKRSIFKILNFVIIATYNIWSLILREMEE